ncbi:MAG TPA: protein tyrosine phosphatase [Sorangium sp.]|nr:protein tyrosine phosphatase [Sorangium sp.]
MNGYIDLHCHWVAGIDDGAHTVENSSAILKALWQVGFSKVIGTPHMRTAMFDNTKAEIEQAYAHTLAALAGEEDLPALGLASEHHLDDEVFAQLIGGGGLPYPGGCAALIEFPNTRFPVHHGRRLFELRCKQIRPVLAHPERYRPVWNDITVLDTILDGGTVLLLDVAALVGKYGRRAHKCANQLLEEGYYYAACSDAHRASDAEAVAKGIEQLRRAAGAQEAQFMLCEGPQRILDGRVED